MENLIKKADISLYGIDDELKNNSSSIYTTKLNSSQYQTITYNTSTYTTSHGYEIFTYTGAIQTFKIPSGTTSVNVYCWGAGGGSSRAELNTTAIRGGNGGFIKATLSIPSGTTSLGIIVGQGGSKGSITGAETTRTAFGGGGSGVNNYIGWGLGGGGGLSGIFVNNANFTIASGYYVNTAATAIIIAGGGGGAGGYSTETGDTHGGSGGFTTANDGSGNRPGGGGSQLAGGTAGTANGYAQGNAGSKYLGGNGTAGSFNPGGGGGYYGGGAGGVEPGKVSGGGGGSSFVNTGSYTITNITNLKNTTNGTAIAVGNTETYYQTGIALGGLTATSSTTTNDGANGLVIIEYLINNTSINSNLLNGGIFNYNTNYNLHYLNNSNYSIKFIEGKIEVETLPTKPSTDYINLFKNPIVWYKFDGSTALLINDSSGNGYNLTNNGATFDNTNYKKGDGSASFVASSGHFFEFPTTLDLNAINVANGITFTCWFRGTTATQDYGGIFHFGTTMAGGTPAAREVGFNRQAGTTNLSFFNITTTTDGNNAGANGLYAVISDQNYFTGAWFFVVYSISKTGYVNIYINNLNKYSAQSIVIPTYTVNRRNCIGKLYTGACLNGNVDDFRIYNYELTAEEVNVLYNNRYIDNSYPLLKDNTGTTINPIGWYKFDNGALTTDSSTNAFTLTNSGTTNNLTNFIKGYGSAEFNGTNYFTSTNATLASYFQQKSFTVSLWLYPKTDNLGFTFSVGGNATGRFWFGYGTQATGIYEFSFVSNNIASAAYTDANTWVYITYTYNFTTGLKSIYRNGVLIASQVEAALALSDNTIFIGRIINSGSYAHNCIIDDFRIYNFELSQSQVNQLYLGRVDILSTNTLKPYYTNNNPYLLLDKTIDGVNYLITTKPSSFIKNNTKKYLFTLTSSIRQLKLSDKAKLIIKSIFIPNVISKSYLQSKAINNVIVKMKEINRNNYLFNSLGNNGNPVIFTSPLKLNTQGFGTTYSFASLPDKNSQSQQSRNLNSDNNGYLFLNPSQDYLFVYDINQDFIENGSIELEVIYDITTVFQNYNETNTYNYIYESLDYTTDRDCLEGLNVNFIIKDVDDSNEMVYEEKSLLNQINNLLLEY